LDAKERENEQEATHIEDTQRLFAEIEMLRVILRLVIRSRKALTSAKKRGG
jgi:hypothetical protein